MKKILFFSAAAVMLSLGLSASGGFGAQTPKAQAANRELTKDQTLAQLKENLTKNGEIFDMIPDLKAAAGRDGKAIFTFRGIALDDISKEDLDKLSTRVRQALVKIRTDRIQRQLEITRQADRLQRVAIPPQPARAPAAMPSIPRTPAPAPAIPQRR